VCPNCEFGHCVTRSLGKTSYVRVASCNRGCYIETFQARLVDYMKILQVVGRNILTQLGSRFST